MVLLSAVPHLEIFAFLQIAIILSCFRLLIVECATYMGKAGRETEEFCLIGEQHPLSAVHERLAPNLAVSINGSQEPPQVVGIGLSNTGGSSSTF